ncbi:family 20 glycosylhydrolase [Levilactobacillus fujinensis]|uniref:beta-N-acetylhexosaminidase n=1 Tax=Levilactobacillus fujinensis TaxID=2486024 RepID=A0ABW1TH29_9LACO|nr:family 20 glycosylhydrolase [Levilactobacillus fujinensis]
MSKKKRSLLIRLILCLSCILFLQVPLTVNAAVQSSQLNHHQGLLIDLGRHPLSESDLQQVIQAAADQKFNDVVLHLSDNEHLSFQSTYLGNSASTTVLSKRSLRRLVTFANTKNIQLVPDVDVPSHAGAILRQLKRKHPQTYRTVKLDKQTLDYTKKQSVAVVNKIYHELDTIFQHQPSHDFILGADEVPGSAAAHKALTRFINQINRAQNKRGFTTAIWNDSLYKHELPKLDSNVVINYWSQSGNHSETKELATRRVQRVSISNLVAANRKIVNANSYATYYQLKYLDNTNDNQYFIDYLRNQYQSNLFNEIDALGQNQNRTLESSVTTDGTLISLWGHDSANISIQQITAFIRQIEIYN